MRYEYKLVTNGPVDKGFVRSRFNIKSSLYKLPCKFSVFYGEEQQSFYIEKSNTHNGVMVLNWSSIAESMRKEWDYAALV
jgi:hypothetical protein